MLCGNVRPWFVLRRHIMVPEDADAPLLLQLGFAWLDVSFTVGLSALSTVYLDHHPSDTSCPLVFLTDPM